MLSKDYYSDITPQRKKRFYLFLLVYVIGYFLLSLIGESINQDGYVVLALFAPLTILIGAIGIAWSFYSGTDREGTEE